MKKTIKIVALSLLLFFQSGWMAANEGMWLLHLLSRINQAEMTSMGLNLTADEIYSINQACLKDAVVRLNGGQCTGEVVSDKGLIFTNHHCAYDAIQGFSSVENDILTNGFCAKSFSQELPIPGFEISFLVRIEDVSKEVLANVTASTPSAERAAAVELAMKAIYEREAANGYEVEVKDFYFGNEYYMLVYETFRDVRLVGNPPESVGKFGGDTDNWMWPRHTGDFSMLRIYADADNKPADYNALNKPYAPKHFFPISLNGVKEDDFAMIMGYPGSTDRFLSSWGVKQALDITNPSTVEIRDLKLKTQKEHMDADPKVRLQYAAKYASTANYWKYFIGQSKGLSRLNVYGKKQKVEQQFTDWVAKDPSRKSTYGDALSLIQQYYNETSKTAKSNVYAIEAGLTGPDMTLFAWRFNRTYQAAQAAESEDQKKAILQSFKEDAEAYFKDYDAATEKDVFIALTELYIRNIAREQRPDWTHLVQDKYKGNVRAFADKLYSTSFMATKEKLFAFIDKPNDKVFNKDMAIMVANSAIAKYRESFFNPAQEKFDTGSRLFVAGQMEMMKDKKWYPDANSTMRLTYGKVGDYVPMDAVQYEYYTTSDGILEKKDNSNPEFVVPANLEELIDKKDFGRYANEKGELVVCFIAGLDITGGNSGSPVLDGDGNLIGIAFDGNWEAMSGDIAYEPELQRTISVDIRYVMWTIDKLMGGKNIVDEVKYAPKKQPKPVDTPQTSPQTPATVKPEGTPKAVPTPAKKETKPAEKGTVKNASGSEGTITKVPATPPKKK
ncbi:MAG: S46 family peptidase [Flavobacteriales bacterium]|nr:S46 family peptidase [Flavobacteriales bacterium]